MRIRDIVRAAKPVAPLILAAIVTCTSEAQFREVAPQSATREAMTPRLAPTRQPFVKPRTAALRPQPAAESNRPTQGSPLPSIRLRNVAPSSVTAEPTPGRGIIGEPTLAEPTPVVVVELKPNRPQPVAAAPSVPQPQPESQPQPELSPVTPTVTAPPVTIAPETSQPAAEDTTVEPAAPVTADIPDTTSTQPAPPVESSATSPSTIGSGIAHQPVANPFDAFRRVVGQQPTAMPSTELGIDAPSPVPLSYPEPIAFNGIVPGVSTRREIVRAWGPPAKSIDAGGESRLIYRAPGFAQVDVVVVGQQVASTIIHLKDTVSVDAFQSPMDLNDIRPVALDDETGEPLGVAFPERGVLLTYAVDDATRVSHVVLEPLRGELFRLRAEAAGRRDYQQCVQDLNHAIRLDPQDARAHWLQGELLSWGGRSEDALEAFRAATRLDADNPLYQISRARVIAGNGQLDEAMATASNIANDIRTPSIVRARAEYLIGNLAAGGIEPDFQASLSHHMKAIDLAAAHIGDTDHDRRRMAKDILVEAHLAVALDIALGNFQRQSEVVPKWLSRATELAEDFIAEDHGDESIRMQIYRTTLATFAILEGNFDATIATEEAIKEGKRLIHDADDRMYQHYIERELAESLFHAAKIENRCGRHDSALRYATNAAILLEDSQPATQPTLFDQMMQGQLFVLAGSIHALHEQDHQEAARWYDKALPTFDDERLVHLVDSTAFGELFVSMGVTYWNVGAKEKAVQLTKAGAELMQMGVQSGSIELAELSVPYGNLATMHGELGDSDSSNHYSAMMAKVEKDAGTRQR